MSKSVPPLEGVIGRYVADITRAAPPLEGVSLCAWFYVESYCLLHLGYSYEGSRSVLRDLVQGIPAEKDSEVCRCFVLDTFLSLQSRKVDATNLFSFFGSSDFDQLHTEIARLVDDTIADRVESDLMNCGRLSFEVHREAQKKTQRLLRCVDQIVHFMEKMNYPGVGVTLSLIRENFHASTNPSDILRKVRNEPV